MPTSIIDLRDRIVTDTGQVVVKYDFLVKRAQSGESLIELPAISHPDILKYNYRSGKTIPIWKDTGEADGVSKLSFAWNIPDAYKLVDVAELSFVALEARNLTRPEYVDRLQQELSLMQERDMFPFIQCLVWIRDVFRENKVVWGVGRGSSCASLVLYLLEINRVDPVRYEIHLEEFFK